MKKLFKFPSIKKFCIFRGNFWGKLCCLCPKIFEHCENFSLRLLHSQCCGSASFVDPDSDSTFQYDDDPDPDPTPTFTHDEKSEKILDLYLQQCQHRLKMELDLQSLFVLHVYTELYSLAETPQLSLLSPHLGLYTRALLVSPDRRHLFVTPWVPVYIV